MLEGSSGWLTRMQSIFRKPLICVVERETDRPIGIYAEFTLLCSFELNEVSKNDVDSQGVVRQPVVSFVRRRRKMHKNSRIKLIRQWCVAFLILKSIAPLRLSTMSCILYKYIHHLIYFFSPEGIIILLDIHLSTII